MKFNTDSHFVIGRSHIRQNKPCQDHAVNALKGNAGIICISDGCSSGGHTDIGARVMTLSTISAIKDRNLRIPIDTTIYPNLIENSLNIHSSMSRMALGITMVDMLATCVYAVVNETGGYIHMLGDGICAIKYRNGNIKATELEWQENMPYYPIYREIGTDIETFLKRHMNKNAGETALKVSEYYTNFDNTLGEVVGFKFIPIEHAINGHVISLEDISNIECVAIFSDGVSDFRDANGERVSAMQIINQMMSFKNHMGDFVKRRVTAAMKENTRDGIGPNDDFSMAVIYIDHSETTEQ